MTTETGRNSTCELPESFRKSYEEFESYPRNLVYNPSFPATIKAYTLNLDCSAGSVFLHNEGEAHVPFRDLKPEGDGEFPDHYSRLLLLTR